MNVIEFDEPVSHVLYFIPSIPALVSSSVNRFSLCTMYCGRISPKALPVAITVVVAHLLAVIQTWPCIAFPCLGSSLIIFLFFIFLFLGQK